MPTNYPKAKSLSFFNNSIDINKINELITQFEQSSLSSLSVKEEQSTIKLKKESSLIVTKTKEIPEQFIESIDIDHQINSPIVGTFYRAPSPESPNFIEIGSQIEVGEVLCVIESMKTMNEITSDKKGIITHIHKLNGEMVEYNEPLFSIKQ